MNRRPVEIDDLLKIQFPHDPALSPDGRRVVFALARLDHDANEFRGTLWMLPLAGGLPTSFTSGEARDTSPVWSPDGSTLAFVMRGTPDSLRPATRVLKTTSSSSATLRARSISSTAWGFSLRRLTAWFDKYLHPAAERVPAPGD